MSDMKGKPSSKPPSITTGDLGLNKATSVPSLIVPPTDDEQMDMANPDSFLGSSLSGLTKPDNLKVVIDDNGNPQLSPNYASRNKAQSSMLFKSTESQMQATNQ